MGRQAPDRLRYPRLAAALFLSLGLTCLPTARAADETAPGRVVSMNLCTDQLALLVAAPGQLHSVSYLAQDPDNSVLAEAAQAYPGNRGRAEDIFLMQPDLILAGTFSNRTSVAMLERLGFRVETFAPAGSFAAIRAAIRRMGRLLGRETRAEALIQDFDARLAAAKPPPGPRPRVLIQAANNYTSGPQTLVHEVMEAAGLRNVAEDLGVTGTLRVPLEVMVMAQPDLVVTGHRQNSPALAQENFRHPAIERIEGVQRTEVGNRYWVCGGPFTAKAVRLLHAAGAQVTQNGGEAGP